MSTLFVSDPSFRPIEVRRTVSLVDSFAERSPLGAFALLSAIYLLIAGALSYNKVLWLDELITLHIAQLGGPVAIWNALANAADPNPPLTHLAVLGSLRLFGEHEFALRLPAILGYWAGLLALFCFLRRRLPAIWALAGVVFSMSNAAFDYSYESRSYGIFYGLAMVAIFCWSRAVDPAASPARRRLALCGMALALAAGICTNYFAVLAFFPIAAGELVRTLWGSSSHARRGRERERWDMEIWIALVLAASPLLAFRHLIQRSIAQFAPHAWNKVSFDQVSDSYTGMVEVIFFPAVALMAFAGVVWLLGRMCSHCRSSLRHAGWPGWPIAHRAGGDFLFLDMRQRRRWS